MPVDGYLTHLHLEKYHPVGFASLIVFFVGNAACLVVHFSMIGSVESQRFLCNTTRKSEEARSLEQDKCYQHYKNYTEKGFPPWAFMFSSALLVIIACLLYQFTIFKRDTDGYFDGHRLCKIATFYIVVLIWRFLIMAIFTILQWSYLYPVWFPYNYNCFIPPSGSSDGKITNGTSKGLVYINCRNQVNSTKSYINIGVFIMNCIAFILTLVEIVNLCKKACGSPGFFNDETFCTNYLRLKGEM